MGVYVETPLLSGRYKLEERLTSEGSRQVWRAMDLIFQRPCVIKGMVVGPGDSAEGELWQEFQSMRHFPHPRIAQALEQGRAEDWPVPGRALAYFTQEWIEGGSLESLRGKLPLAQVRECVIRLLEVVAFLHLNRLTRLDLKSAHLLRSLDGWRMIDLDQARLDSPLGVAELHGTLAYVAPEVLKGDPGSPQADLYSVGALLYEALTGSTLPLEGDTLEEVANRLLRAPVPDFPPELAAQDPELVGLARTMLERQPSRRPASAAEALKALGVELHLDSLPLVESRLLSRDQALERLKRAEAQANLEQGGAARLSGPSRSGHSRLLAEGCGRLLAAGQPALQISSRQVSHLPLGGLEVFLKFLRLQTTGAGEVLPDETWPAAPPETSSQEARETLVQAALRRLLSAAEQASQTRSEAFFALFLDDPAELDELSQQVLRRLMPVLAGSHLWLVMGGAGAADLAAGAEALEIPLLPLDAGQVRLMASQTLPGEAGILNADEVSGLLRATEGVVGYVREALERRWRDPPFCLDEWVPGDVSWLSDQVQSISSPAVISVLRAVAVFSGPCELTMLEQLVADEGEGVDARAAAGEAVIAGQLAWVGNRDGEPHLQFARESLRRAVLRAMPQATYRETCLRAAEALEQACMLSHSVPAAAVARLFLAADSPRRARPYLLRAVEEAERALELSGAAQMLRELIASSRPGDVQRGQLQLRLGQVELDQGAYPAARSTFRDLLESAVTLTPAARAQALAGLARARMHLNEHGQARQELEAAVALGPTPALHPARGTSSWVSVWRQWLAWLCMESGDLDQAAAALAQARRDGILPQSVHLVEQLRLEAYLGLRQGDALGNLEGRLQEALSLAQSLQHVSSQLKVLNGLAEICRRTGNRAGQRSHLEALLSLARHSYQLEAEAVAAYNLAVTLQEQEDGPTALEHLERSATLFQRLKNGPREAHIRLQMAALLLEYGQLERAKLTLDRVASLLAGSGDDLVSQRDYHALLGCRLARLKGAREGLQARLVSLAEAFAKADQLELLLETLVDSMTLALEEGHPASALSVLAPRTESLERGPVRLRQQVHALAARAHLSLAGMEERGRERGHRHTAQGEDRARDAAQQTLRASAAEVDPETVRSGKPEETASGGSMAKDGGKVSRAGGQPVVLSEPSMLPPAVWVERLRSILEVADEVESLAAELAAMVGELFSARGLVLLCDAERPRVIRSFRMDEEQVGDISYTLIEQVRQSREPYVCADIRVDRRMNRMRSLRDAAIQSLVCYPVVEEEACLGVIYIDHPHAGRLSGSEVLSAIEQIGALTGRLLQSMLRRRKQVSCEPTDFELVGESEPMKRLKARLTELALSTDPDLVVLLQGETGTGKSRTAREIHQRQRPRRGDFEAINCAAISPGLFESEIFGHVKGAFTGAYQEKRGALELARGGMLLLDEIGEVPMDLQAKLLDVLQTRRFTRVGAPHQKLNFEAQLVCATNRNLRQDVAAGRFRADLLRRIHVNVVTVPPLRERGAEDIRLLARHQIHRYLGGQKLLPAGSPLVPLEAYLTRQAEQTLVDYPWPWNVGELENLFRNEGVRSHLRTGGKDRIESRLVEDVLDLKSQSLLGEERGRSTAISLPRNATIAQLNDWWNRQKVRYIGDVYRECNENASEAARRLDCSRDLVHRSLKEETEG